MLKTPGEGMHALQQGKSCPQGKGAITRASSRACVKQAHTRTHTRTHAHAYARTRVRTHTRTHHLPFPGHELFVTTPHFATFPRFELRVAARVLLYLLLRLFFRQHRLLEHCLQPFTLFRMLPCFCVVPYVAPRSMVPQQTRYSKYCCAVSPWGAQHRSKMDFKVPHMSGTSTCARWRKVAQGL